MPTVKQKLAMRKVKKTIENGLPVNMGKIMQEVGYSKATSTQPQVLTESKSWIETMKEIDYGLQLKQVEELGDIRLNSDKDNALKAKDMLFKLGDKYPKGETKIIGIFNKIDAISDPEP
jgi:hypothetical protein